MNLINGIHNFCERREYTFNVLPEYSIITRERESEKSGFREEEEKKCVEGK